MSSIQGGYDLSTSTYSPDGRIFQLEYTSKFIKKSNLIIGLICSDGILLIAENSNENKEANFYNSKKIFSINSRSGVAGTGQSGDLFRIVERIRCDQKNFKKNFSEGLVGRTLANKIQEIIHFHSIYWHLRPFICSLVLGTGSPKSPELFSILPSGYISKNLVTIIGKNSSRVKFSLTPERNLLNSCRQNLKIISRNLIEINKMYDIEIFEVFWFSKDSKDFTKPIPYNFKRNLNRINEILFRKNK
jgi:20S proteasome subunit alpha 7